MRLLRFARSDRNELYGTWFAALNRIFADRMRLQKTFGDSLVLRLCIKIMSESVNESIRIALISELLQKKKKTIRMIQLGPLRKSSSILAL